MFSKIAFQNDLIFIFQGLKVIFGVKEVEIFDI